MTTRTWLNRNVVGIGEAMVEFAPVGENVYRRGFAGDTLNTCWHIAQIVRDHGRVGYFTRVGTDVFSAEFIDFLAASGLEFESDRPRSDAFDRPLCYQPLRHRAKFQLLARVVRCTTPCR